MAEIRLPEIHKQNGACGYHFIRCSDDPKGLVTIALDAKYQLPLNGQERDETLRRLSDSEFFGQHCEAVLLETLARRHFSGFGHEEQL